MTTYRLRFTLARLSLAFLALLALVGAIGAWQTGAGAQAGPTPTTPTLAAAGSLDGMWRMVATRQLGAPAISDVPVERQTKFKLITGSHYIWYVYNPDTKDIDQSLTGLCSLDGGTYTETAQFGSYPELLGKPQAFTLKLEGDKMHLWGTLQMGGDHPWTRPLEEVWERVK